MNVLLITGLKYARMYLTYIFCQLYTLLSTFETVLTLSTSFYISLFFRSSHKMVEDFG